MRPVPENIFPRAHVEGWRSYGIFPPPLHGAYNWPPSVHFVLACQDLWDLEGPPLDCSDEEGVEIQRARCEANMRTIPSRTTPIPGTDLLIIGPAEE